MEKGEQMVLAARFREQISIKRERESKKASDHKKTNIADKVFKGDIDFFRK